MNAQTTNTVSNKLSQDSTIANTLSHLDIYGVALIIITIALLVIAISLINISRKINKIQSVPANLNKRTQRISVEKKSTEPGNDEVQAAIALALHFHQNELHDSENAVLTINRVTKFYSPWSSKIYGLSKNPR
jgi:glutaconyl-CoA/methylmalonyl-CoA decarboxylase subunit delta